MSAADIMARIRRLEQLTRGVARELQLVERTKIFQYRERRDYFDALRYIWIGLENARDALVKARQRLDSIRTAPEGPPGQ
jgi:hypothetical protein